MWIIAIKNVYVTLLWDYEIFAIICPSSKLAGPMMFLKKLCSKDRAV